MSDLIQIDLENIIKSKNPKILNWIPKFLINWMKGFIHQEYINKILLIGEGKTGTDFIEVIFNELNINLTSVNIENIPKTGGCIIAANHPLGGLDGLALMLAVSKVRKDFLFLANDILMNVKPLKDNFLAVNRTGKPDRKSLELIKKGYESGKVIVIFPSGFVSRKFNNIVRDLNWHKSVVKKSIEHNLPIIPTYIDGANSNRFYRISRFRKFFKIKVNIEMLTLPDEMFKQQGKTIEMTFGKSVTPDNFGYSTMWEDAQKLKEYVYQLKENSEAIYKN